MTFLGYLLLILATVPASEKAGTVCIDDQCRPVRSSTYRLEPAAVPRRFIWISGDQTHLAAGAIQAGARELDLALPAEHRVAVRLSDGKMDVPLTIELRGPNAQWTWTLARVPRKPIRIAHVPCECSLTIRATGYKPTEKAIGKESGDLGESFLYRLPVISGTVIDSTTSVPVGGAEITIRDQAVTTDAQGRFALVIEKNWPRFVQIVHPPRAARIVEVPVAPRDVDLGRVTLSNGGAVHVVLAPPLNQEKLQWDLRKLVGKKSEGVKSGTLQIQSEFAVSGIEAGRYVLVIRGEGPLQQVGVSVSITEGQTSEAIARADTAIVEIEATWGDTPLASTAIDLEHVTAGWEGRVTTDEDGRAVEEIWQQGEFWTIVSTQEIQAWSDMQEISGEGRIHVTLEIPQRTITGHVIDASTGQPVADAKVMLRTRSHDAIGLSSSTSTTADGSFVFNGVTDGQQTLSVAKSGYHSHATWQFTLGESDTLAEHELKIEPITAARTVMVTNAVGAPLPSAVVYFVNAEGMRIIGFTGSDGTIRVPLLSPDERGMVYVVPRTGSFAWARIAGAQKDTEPMTIPVSDAASLEIRAESLSGEPIPDIPVLMRIDGVTIPIEVLAALHNFQGAPLHTDQNGRLHYPRMPAGAYELWPVTSKTDLWDFYAGRLAMPPVKVQILAGHQTAILKFRPKTGP